MADPTDGALTQPAQLAAQAPMPQTTTSAPDASIATQPTNQQVNLGGSQADATHDFKGDWTGGGKGIFGKMERGVVNSAGRPTPTFTQDDAGNLVQSAVQASPGTLFKRLLMGAMTGLGTAAQHPGLGFGGGLGIGFEGATQQEQQQEDRNRQQAVQQGQMKQKQQQVDMDKQRLQMEQKNYQLQEAHWNIDSLRQQHVADLQDQEHLESENSANGQMEDKVIEAGGKALEVKGSDGKNVNGIRGQGNALMQQYTAGQVKPQNGGTLKLVHSYDVAGMKTDGVHYDVDAGFYKDKDGNRANIGNYITNTVYEVPQNAMTQTVQVPKSEMARFGVKTAAATTQMPFGTYLGLASKAKEEEVSLSNSQMQRDVAVYDSTNNQLSSLYEKKQAVLDDPVNAARIAKDPKVADQLTSGFDKQIEPLEEVRDKIGTRFGMKPPVAATASSVLPAPTQAGYVTVQFPDNRGVQQIPAANLAAFRQKFPKALFKQGEAVAPSVPSAPLAGTPYSRGAGVIEQAAPQMAQGALSAVPQ